MRYYYYGNQEKSTSLDRVRQERAERQIGSGVAAVSMAAREQRIEGDLVIEEDTVYEIDRDCLRCKGNPGCVQ